MIIQKYLIVKDTPVLFSSSILHAYMVSAAGKVESAGFFVLHRSKADHSLKVICFGESSSLLISSRPDVDQQLISSYLGIHD